MMVIKPQGLEVSLATGDTVANATLVRVINVGAAAPLSFTNNANTVYANLTVSNTESVVVQKATDDVLTGANMRGVPIAWKY